MLDISFKVEDVSLSHLNQDTKLTINIVLSGKEQPADNVLPILTSTITEFADPTIHIVPPVDLKVNASLATVDSLSEITTVPLTIPPSTLEMLYALFGLDLTVNNVPPDHTTSMVSALPLTHFVTLGTTIMDSVLPVTMDTSLMETTVSSTTKESMETPFVKPSMAQLVLNVPIELTL